MDEVLKDSRFAHIAKDPKFRQMKRKERKVKIDKRFHGMFKDKKFKLKYQVDKRGRPITSTTNEDLKKYYDASDSEDEDEDKDAGPSVTTDKRGKKNKRVKNEKSVIQHEDSDQSDIEVTETKRDKQPKKAINEKVEVLKSSQSEASEDSEESDGDESSLPDITKVDLARGEGAVMSSSEEEGEFDFKEDEFDHKWGEIDQDATPVEDATLRLAICNMDWDRIKAVDLMVLLSSFKPASGLIKSVTIYPSEYGLERMKKEEVQGPIELTEKPLEEVDDENDGAEYNREKLRQYQLNRLKYYYAVAECDSTNTANTIYEQCDGIEYESSSARLDLRFIPDDMEFDHAPKDQVSEMPSATTYKPSLFANSALQQSNVRLTWDETPQDRIAVTMKKYKADELEDMDLKDYLASSSGEEDDDVHGVGDGEDDSGADEPNEDDAISKYKSLITDINNAEKNKEDNDLDMEITWEPGLKETTENIVRKKEEEKDNVTPWDKYLQKKKDKQTKKRDDIKKKEDNIVEDNSDEESDDYIPAGVDMDDPYFKEEMDKLDNDIPVGKKAKKKNKKKRIGDKTEVELKEEAEIALLTMDETDPRKHFSLEKIMESEAKMSKKKKKKLKRKNLSTDKTFEDDFNINVEDSRFKAIFENPMYNIDPSAPQFKNTKAMNSIITEKAKRRKRKDTDIDPSSIVSESRPATVSGESDKKKFKTDVALASLVKSVKNKTKTLNSKKTKKHHS